MTSSPANSCVVYIANADSQDLTVFDLRTDGEMVPLGTVVIRRPAQIGRSVVLTLDPKRRFLYAGHLCGAGQSAVATFEVSRETGLPSYRGTTPLADTTSYLSTDRTGRYLFSASYAGNKVTVNAIAPDGIVGATLQIVETQPKAHCIVADPSNRFVLHTSLGGDLIYQSRFDARTGLISPNTPPMVAARAKSGPRFVIFAARGKQILVVNELDGTIDLRPFDPASGIIGAISQSTSILPDRFVGQPWGADIHFRPDGAFLYASERTTSVITAFAVDPESGALARLESYPTVKQPRAFHIDPFGRHLIAAGQLSNTVACHAIDAANGELSALGEYPVGRSPTWVEVVALA